MCFDFEQLIGLHIKTGQTPSDSNLVVFNGSLYVKVL